MTRAIFAVFTSTWLLLLAFVNARIELNTERQCLKNYIEVIQVPVVKLPSGSQVYSVQILNECPNGCKIGEINLSCGSFHSERFISPKLLRHLSINECLVNDGKPIASGAAVSFTYVSPEKFPFVVSSLSCSN